MSHHRLLENTASSLSMCVSYHPQGRVEVNSETGELKLLVKINTKSGAEAKKSKAVKDLKQLSGAGW